MYFHYKKGHCHAFYYSPPPPTLYVSPKKIHTGELGEYAGLDGLYPPPAGDAAVPSPTPGELTLLYPPE